MKRVGLTIIVLALGVICFVAPVTADEYRIGVLLPLSGPAALTGNETLEGISIAEEIINERGGVNGNKVIFVKADAPDPTAAATECNRLITQENVKVIIPSGISGNAVAATGVAEKAKVFSWEINTASPLVTGRGLKYVFRTVCHGGMLGEDMSKIFYRYLPNLMGMDPKEVKLVVVHEDGPYGQSLNKAIVDGAQALGYKAHSESYSVKLTDLSSLVLKLKGMNPNIICGVGFANDSVLLAKQMKQYDFTPKVFLGVGNGYTDRAFTEGRGKDAAGFFVYRGAPIISGGSRSMPEEAVKLSEEFLTHFRKKYNREPTDVPQASFVGLMVLFTHVIPRAGSLDADKLRAAALALDIPYGGLSNGWGIKFDETGQNQRAFLLLAQYNTELKLVSVYPPEAATGKPIMVPLPPWSERK